MHPCGLFASRDGAFALGAVRRILLGSRVRAKDLRGAPSWLCGLRNVDLGQSHIPRRRANLLRGWGGSAIIIRVLHVVDRGGQGEPGG